MIAAPQIIGIEIDPEAWSVPPASIQTLVVYLVGENEGIVTGVSQIEEHLGQNSQNSSQPPSEDGFGKKIRPKREKSEKKRGGQTCHSSHQAKYYALSDRDVIENHLPAECGQCGLALSGENPGPYRHQILEIPPLRPEITEHRLHQITCSGWVRPPSDTADKTNYLLLHKGFRCI
jgi:transposase